ncbi:MAPEG family protein [Croceicoccus sp. F390]|uniref:MAPEG family protein n=1 Tax=Croceicoccus esteveae TaxID=3075597 RepID=A0ABU2ZJN2_9SPHN|nr:MAPEG family protein [Croceicoccus sp. F390]MDT0576818.1 MAPEG family protein [Croceicoccus sp. F390]
MLAVEIRILVYAAILLLVHIMVEGYYKTKQYGREWNMGARDEALPPADPMVGRLGRARANYMETLPIAIIALLGVVIGGKAGFWTGLGGWIWLGARVIYLPLYWAGVPRLRSLVWAAGMIGLAIVIWPLLWSS